MPTILVLTNFIMSNMSLNLRCVNIEHTDNASICRRVVITEPRARSDMHSDSGGSVMDMLLLMGAVVI